MASPSSSLCSSLASPRAASLGHRRRLAFSSPRKAFQVKASARVDKYSKNDIIVSPSILSANFAKLGDQVKAVEVAGCDWIHVDVVDGRLEPNITIGPLVVDALRPVTGLPLCKQGNRHEMGLRLPFFLLLLLVVTSGAAQARSTVVLGLHTSEVRDPGPIYKEQITSSKIPVPLGRGSPLCSTCENFTSEAVSYLSEKQTQDKIMEILHDACSQTFSLEQKCVELVDSYATLLFAKITEVKPDEFCKQYGLCRDIAFLSGVKSDSTCVFCHHLVDEVLSKLKDPDAEFEIIQLLLKECNKIEGHVQQCKRMVLQYIPLILVNGEKFLEKNDLCALIQACDASQKSTVGSFFEGGLRSDA